MLSARDARRDTGRRRAPPSQRQQYDAYVMERIEAFKDSISREELMRLASEAANELQAGSDEGQFLLTELLMTEMVDEHIRKRLRLPSFGRWKRTHGKLRSAQREPTHWGLDRNCPLVALLPRIEPADHVLVLGRGAEARAYLLAAHDVEVSFWDVDAGIVDRVEAKMRDEGLFSRFFGISIGLSGWLPAIRAPFSAVVIDLDTLAELHTQLRHEVLARLQSFTTGGGAHVLLPGRKLVPEALASDYAEWTREKLPSPVRRSGAREVLLTKPQPEDARQARRA